MGKTLFVLLLSFITIHLEAKEYSSKLYRFKIDIPDEYTTTFDEKSPYCLKASSPDQQTEVYVYAINAGEDSKFKVSVMSSLDTQCYNLSTKVLEKKSFFSNRIMRGYELKDNWKAKTITIYARQYCYVLLHLYKEDVKEGTSIIADFSASHEGCVQNFVTVISGKISENGFMSFIATIILIIWCTSIFWLCCIFVIALWDKCHFIVALVLTAGVIFIFLYLTLHDSLIDFMWGNIGFGEFAMSIFEMFSDD